MRMKRKLPVILAAEAAGDCIEEEDDDGFAEVAFPVEFDLLYL
jgi:hypothetical protein